MTGGFCLFYYCYKYIRITNPKLKSADCKSARAGYGVMKNYEAFLPSRKAARAEGRKALQLQRLAGFVCFVRTANKPAL